MSHNWSATKQCLYPQSVAKINCHSVLSADRIRQCETSSGSHHKDTDQCLSGPPMIYGDNQGAIALSKNPVNHQRSKHIDVRYHFVRTEVNSGKVVEYCSTADMDADVMTKPVTKVKLRNFKDFLFGQLFIPASCEFVVKLCYVVTIIRIDARVVVSFC